MAAAQIDASTGFVVPGNPVDELREAVMCVQLHTALESLLAHISIRPAAVAALSDISTTLDVCRDLVARVNSAREQAKPKTGKALLGRADSGE